MDLGGQVLLLIINCVRFGYLARSCRLCSPECGLVRRQAWQAAVVDATRGLLCERGRGRAPQHEGEPCLQQLKGRLWGNANGLGRLPLVSI